MTNNHLDRFVKEPDGMVEQGAGHGSGGADGRGDRLRVDLVITALECGGAERVMSLLANHLVEAGHEVRLLVLNPSGAFYPLDDRVHCRFLSSDQASSGSRVRWLAGVLRRLVVLRKALRQARPDVVISFIEVANVWVLLAGMGTGLPVIVSERVYPPSHAPDRRYRVLRRLVYPFARFVVVQTSAVARWAVSWLDAARVRVIPNPALAPPEAGSSEPEITLSRGNWMVAMGRLVHQKGFDMLIDAFARLAVSLPDWSLLILGDGELRQALEQQVQRHSLTGRVVMPGIVQHPEEVLRQCDLFVLTSRYEGFPNACCEALATGLPVVAFDCPAGPRDIIRDGIDGLLIPPGDVAALTTALERVIQDKELRDRLAGRAGEIVERFAAEPILETWEQLCYEAAGRRDEREP